MVGWVVASLSDQMIALPDITLCCIDCVTPRLAMRALRQSLGQCAFGAALLLTDADISDDQVQVRRIAAINDKRGYSAFVLKHLLPHIATDFALLVQWDGYVVDGTRWEDGFRAVDYIGAPWSWRPAGQQLGNGGFSLRSRRLLAILAGPEVPVGHPEDALICRSLRPSLEARGIRFADPETARRFAVEIEPVVHDQGPSFGFHGLHHLWRSLPAAALPELLAALPAGWLRSDGAGFLVAAYAARRRWAEAQLVLEAMEREQGETATVHRLGVTAVEGAALRARIIAQRG